jgi:hypothetical protein
MEAEVFYSGGVADMETIPTVLHFWTSPVQIWPTDRHYCRWRTLYFRIRSAGESNRQGAVTGG